MRHLIRVVLLFAAILAITTVPIAQAPVPAAKAAVHAKQVKRLLIRNAMVIPGNATPAYGPTDILAEDGLISRIGESAQWPDPDMVIDGTGKYVMPGIVN